MSDNLSAPQPSHKQIHLIGNAHIDPTWLWRWVDGFSEVKATFQAALDRLHEYPDFIFTCAGACYYQWVEENCPPMFEEIRRFVAEGRWVIVNGWWLQPDCNIPCGESFVRQSLYGQRYYLSRFGRICDTGYNVDSFGHNGMLPQILSKSGMNQYVFMRPSDQEKPGVPHLFWWQSPDGSRVLTYKIPYGYGHGDAASFPEKVEAVGALAEDEQHNMMLFYGVGNHGGGPTIAVLDKIEQMRQVAIDPAKQAEHGSALVFSSPPQYMAQIRKTIPADQIPVIADDLQYHAIGCYSAMLAVKQWNRRAEQRLMAAERFDSLAHALFQSPLHTAELGKAWQKVMFNQFHDILAGCSIKTAYDDAGESFGYALSTAAEILNSAVQRISWAVDTLGEDRLPRSKEEDWKYWGIGKKGTPLVVFNPLPFPVEQPVEAGGELAAITDHELRPLMVQRIRSIVTNGANDKWNTLFVAKLPALGYATYWLHQKAKPHEAADNQSGLDPVACADIETNSAQDNKIVDRLICSADGSRMSNRFVEVGIDLEQAVIASIRDSRTGRAYTAGKTAAGLVIDETHSDTWGHALSEYRDVAGSFSGVSAVLLDDGPLRGRVRLTSRYQDSTMIQDVILYADRPDIEIRVKIHWREQHKMLKLEFPVAGQDLRMTREIPYGFLETPMDGREKPFQQWVDISGRDGGLAVINDSSYSMDVKDSVLRQTVLRSPIYADHFGHRDDECEFMEQGEHEVRYLIVPHEAGWQAAGVVQKALALNAPPITVNETYHHGPLPLTLSGISVSSSQIVALVLKVCEDRDGWIVRCNETHGAEAQARISLQLSGREWDTQFGPCEIKTFYVPFAPDLPVEEVNLIELT